MSIRPVCVIIAEAVPAIENDQFQFVLSCNVHTDGLGRVAAMKNSARENAFAIDPDFEGHAAAIAGLVIDADLREESQELAAERVGQLATSVDSETAGELDAADRDDLTVARASLAV